MNNFRSAIAYDAHPDRFAFVLFLLLGAWYIATLQVPRTHHGDTDLYFGLAESLLQGRGYSFNFRWHTRFPPGYPLLLAVQFLVVGTSFHATLVAQSIMAVLGLIATYFLLRQQLPAQLALGISLLLGTSPFFYEMVTTNIRSDIPYFTCTMTTLWAARKLLIRPSAPIFVAFMFLLLFSVFLRSAGIALLAGFAVWMMSQRLRTEGQQQDLHFAPAVIGVFLALFAWQHWISLHHSELWSGEYMDSYVSQMKLVDPHQPELGNASLLEIVSRIPQHALEQATHVAELLLRVRWFDPLWFSPLPLFVFLFGIFGILDLLRTNDAYIAWYCLMYAGVYVLWPWDESMRFILPLFPLVMLCLVSGVAEFLKLSARRSQIVFRAWVLASLFLALSSAYWLEHASAQAGLQAKLSCFFWFLAVFGAIAVHNGNNFWQILCSCFQRYRSRVLRACVVLLCISGLVEQVALARINLSISESELYHFPTVIAARWLKDHVPAGTVLMAEQDAIVHSITHARVIGIPVTTDVAKLREPIDRFSVDYLVIIRRIQDPYFIPSEDTRLALIEAAFPDFLQLVFRSGNTEIYRVHRLSEFPASENRAL